MQDKKGNSLMETLQRAIGFHETGKLSGAEHLYEAILRAQPEEFDSRHYEALHYLGLLEAQQGRLQEAYRLISHALSINPKDAKAHSNVGNVLQGLKRYEQALASYETALAINPGDANSWNSRGVALYELKHYAQALSSYDRALALKPDYAEAHNNRGNALLEIKRPEEALACYDRALALKPDSAEFCHNRGNALLELKRPAQALACHDRALALKPDSANFYNSRGNALVELKRQEEALVSYQRALALDGGYADAHFNRALTLRSQGNHQDAVEEFRRALDLKPDYENAIGALFYSRRHCCDWYRHSQECQRIVSGVRAGETVIEPFPFVCISDSAQDQLSCAQAYVHRKYPASPSPLWSGERYRHDRIRLAYLSADFRAHPSSFLLAGMFEHHDRSRFETIAISFGDDDQSEIRTRLKVSFERFIDVRDRSDLEVARLMRELEVDIAVDLMGHTQYSRMGILALRPAPVQVNYLGYPGTMGSDYIDYIICDRVVIPEDHHVHYTEKMVYLPDTFQANDSKRRIAEHAQPRAEVGLPDDGFVFCSFNNTYKFTPAMFDIWMRLLRRVEGSVLWLQEVNATATKNLRREAIQRGIDANRLVFAPRVPRLEDHLARYRLADLFLDTLPYNAHTTASDALWAGLPVLTCMGASFAGRVGGSLLSAIGLPELITHSLADYEALALKLAIEGGMLVDIKAKHARNRESFPLFDIDRFRRHIETAYATMWERYQRGESPASFEVERLVQPVV
jgi:protein O-GlcNAc transferase